MNRTDRPLMLFCLAFLLFSASASAQANLLVNPSFESGSVGWTTTASSSSVVAYGSSTSVPDVPLGSHIGGGNLLLRDTGGNAVVEQTVSLATAQPGDNLRAGGYFGGAGPGDSRLVLVFRDGGGNVVAQRNLDYVTPTNRNQERVLMLRDMVLTIPLNASTVTARIEFRTGSCCSATGGADALYVHLTPMPVVPPAVPLGVELVQNGGFELGWGPSSPLTPTLIGGWEGTSGITEVVPYSASDPAAPHPAVSCAIGGALPASPCVPGGAGNLLRDVGGGALRQRVDVRANTFPFQSTQLLVSGFMGGMGTITDTARIDVVFLDEMETVIAPLRSVGPVTAADRNGETVVVRREQRCFVPSSTAYIEITVVMGDFGCCAARGLIDNVSAMLVPPTSVPPLPYNVNLVDNGSFESGSLPGSPLQLPNSGGWFGTTGRAVATVPYGAPRTGVPATAPAPGLGGHVLEDVGGGGVLRQVIDLTGSQSVITAGSLWFYAEAWLGGHLNETDDAELRIQFLNSVGVQVGSGGAPGLHVLGPVTPGMRGGATTLVLQTAGAQIPTPATQAVIELRFRDFGCCTAFGLADGIHFSVYDVLRGGGPNPVFPGSGDSFELYTGVGGIPTSGPGNFVKTTVGGDVLNVLVASPGGDYDFQPLLLCMNVFATGGPIPMPPAGFPAGFALDPFNDFFILENGLDCTIFGCPVVLPGGTLFPYLIPSGLSGTSFVLQAYALPIPGGPPPANGVIAATNGHEIRIM